MIYTDHTSDHTSFIVSAVLKERKWRPDNLLLRNNRIFLSRLRTYLESYRKVFGYKVIVNKPEKIKRNIHLGMKIVKYGQHQDGE